MENPTFGGRLKALFRSKGLAEAEVARRAGMTPQQLNEITSGRRANPGVETVRRIVEAAGGTMGEVFDN